MTAETDHDGLLIIKFLGEGMGTKSGTNWTSTMERYFIELMVDHVQRGNRLGHTFSKQACADMF